MGRSSFSKLLEVGKPLTRHREQNRFARELLISAFKEGEELAEIYRKVEKLHANFYHAFLEPDELEKLRADGMKLVEFLGRAIEERLKYGGA